MGPAHRGRGLKLAVSCGVPRGFYLFVLCKVVRITWLVVNPSSTLDSEQNLSRSTCLNLTGLLNIIGIGFTVIVHFQACLLGFDATPISGFKQFWEKKIKCNQNCYFQSSWKYQAKDMRVTNKPTTRMEFLFLFSPFQAPFLLTIL